MNIIQVYKRFPDEASCIAHLEKVRWNNKPVCPYCKASRFTARPKERRYHCNNCNTTFSVTVGTIFHDSKLALQKWFLAVSIILNAKKGISARQLARDIEVNKNTAWYMGMRIRRAMLDSGELLRGIIEMDETYVGGKPRGHKKDRKRGRGTSKIPVVGMVERQGGVKATVTEKINSRKLMSLVRRSVDTDNSTLMTDEWITYGPFNKIMPHNVINHSVAYVDGDNHTNTIECFWSLLKRGIVGQYHKVSRRHLQQYVNEFAFRFSNRGNENIFDLTLQRAVGA